MSFITELYDESKTINSILNNKFARDHIKVILEEFMQNASNELESIINSLIDELKKNTRDQVNIKEYMFNIYAEFNRSNQSIEISIKISKRSEIFLIVNSNGVYTVRYKDRNRSIREFDIFNKEKQEKQYSGIIAYSKPPEKLSNFEEKLFNRLKMERPYMQVNLASEVPIMWKLCSGYDEKERFEYSSGEGFKYFKYSVSIPIEKQKDYKGIAFNIVLKEKPEGIITIINTKGEELPLAKRKTIMGLNNISEESLNRLFLIIEFARDEGISLNTETVDILKNRTMPVRFIPRNRCFE